MHLLQLWDLFLFFFLFLFCTCKFLLTRLAIKVPIAFLFSFHSERVQKFFLLVSILLQIWDSYFSIGDSHSLFFTSNCFPVWLPRFLQDTFTDTTLCPCLVMNGQMLKIRLSGSPCHLLFVLLNEAFTVLRVLRVEEMAQLFSTLLNLFLSLSLSFVFPHLPNWVCVYSRVLCYSCWLNLVSNISRGADITAVEFIVWRPPVNELVNSEPHFIFQNAVALNCYSLYDCFLNHRKSAITSSEPKTDSLGLFLSCM